MVNKYLFVGFVAIIILFVFAFYLWRIYEKSKEFSIEERACILGSKTYNNTLGGFEVTLDVVSREQAICLINGERVLGFHNYGSPFYVPDGFIKLDLISGKSVLLGGNVKNLTMEFNDLGVKEVRK